MKLVSVEDIELLHMQIIDASSGMHGVRDRERLKGIVEQVVQEVFGMELYPSIYDKSASLMFGIIMYHPFPDGNKRTGILSALLLLNLNNIDTGTIKDQELEDFAVKVAVENLEVPKIATWLKKHSA